MAGAGDQRRDFFISYTGADRAWAEWAAWQLEEAGYSTVLQAWDFRPGDNFVARMRDALEQADRTIALISQAYLASPYCTDEWTGAFLHDQDTAGRLLPVRIEACELPRLLATQVYIDLVGLGRQQARTRGQQRRSAVLVPKTLPRASSAVSLPPRRPQGIAAR